jgi:hypothetical protein
VKAAFALGLHRRAPRVHPHGRPDPQRRPGDRDGLRRSAREKALVGALAYWGIQFLENNLLIPCSCAAAMDIPPAITLVAQALMTLVFGFLGLMVAVPLTAASWCRSRCSTSGTWWGTRCR